MYMHFYSIHNRILELPIILEAIVYQSNTISNIMPIVIP